MHKKIILIAAGIIILLLLIITAPYLKYTSVFFQLLFNKEISLKKENNNVNLLLLGVGGGKHDGFDLTDTIIFTSIDQSKNKITLVSIPRDLWIPDLNTKINEAYHQGEVKKKGGGLILTKAVVSSVINQPVDYIILGDFEGFVKAVDLIGGIDVMVDKSFDDYEYPIEGKENDLCGHNQDEIQNLVATVSSQPEAFPCRYKKIHFEAGNQHMDGQTALEFVRSRHAKGEEGTDFARSRRQEKVISAFKDKVLTVETFLNPVKMLSLYDILKSSIVTNINQNEYDDFIKLAQKMKNAKIQSAVLDYGDEQKNRPGLLINPWISGEYKNQWVLIPRIGNGDFLEIQKYIYCEIKEGECPIPNP